ncbi:MAG: pyruvate dehydrogenase (acetyl-transferring) E1 component subunit alpha, partial [Alphaproteobacteria bacterium]|nr:pyruvate dehydrogenase (acetyl-transferring) E1 component subunit alpha [Alphaproteobacteria bacterium]
GMDVLAVREAGLKAVEHVRAGGGPMLLEMKTYRYRGHSMSDPAKYRSREEVEDYKEHRDPIEGLKQKLMAQQTGEEQLKKIDQEIKQIVADAAQFAQESPEPDDSELWTDVVG